MEQEVTVRRMSRAEAQMAASWAAREGWNPGLHDAESFYSTDPDGFFVAERAGQPVGCISAVAYDDAFGFVGFYIVRDGLRGEGIGTALSRAALEYLGGRTIGADGVVAMLEKYGQLGFQIAHFNARYEGLGAASAARLAELRAVPFDEVAAYDRRFFPARRAAFLRCWLDRPNTHSLAVRVGGRLAGYGVVRPCLRGFKLAPLFADSPELAEELFSALSSFAAGEPLFLDIPVCNRAALALVERHAMTKVFETARIYRGGAPVLPLDDTYGITSFELG